MTRAPYQKKSGDSSHYAMLKELELTYDSQIELKKHCDELGIEFMSTPYDEESAKFLHQLGVKRMKVASADIIHRPLLECLGEIGLPVIQSTGMATIGEVDRAVGIFRTYGINDITLLHCVSSYPLEPAQVNMQWMDCLRETFRLPTGYSDHTMGFEIPIMAVSLGAVVSRRKSSLGDPVIEQEFDDAVANTGGTGTAAYATKYGEAHTLAVDQGAWYGYILYDNSSGTLDISMTYTIKRFA